VKRSSERRINRRYNLHLPLHYRVARRGLPPITGLGTTRDVSSMGLSFRCRRALPIGSHVELSIEWPARHGEDGAIELHVSGQIVRSDGGKISVAMSSRQFRIHPLLEPYRATA
jgi:hypothetical protein